MEFIYADELKKRFSVFGHFYDLQINNQIFQCRSVLEIISKSIDDASDSIPCAVVVMMNPGSSRPLDKDYVPRRYLVSQIMSENWEKDIIPARPDNAQYQIMRLMLLKDWKHVRILNLSDLRNGNSGKFSIEFEKADKLDQTHPHSLTNIARQKELLAYCYQAPLIIAAWGSTEVLKNSAKRFIVLISHVKGLPLQYPWYRYPSPYKKKQKMEWLECMESELKNV